MAVPILILSVVIFFVLFFGIGFILNMLLRMTWIMAVLCPIVFIAFIDDVSVGEYFTNTRETFSTLGTKIVSLAPADIIILSSGLAGAILSGVVIRMLRTRGYRMF